MPYSQFGKMAAALFCRFRATNRVMCPLELAIGNVRSPGITLILEGPRFLRIPNVTFWLKRLPGAGKIETLRRRA